MSKYIHKNFNFENRFRLYSKQNDDVVKNDFYSKLSNEVVKNDSSGFQKKNVQKALFYHECKKPQK